MRLLIVSICPYFPQQVGGREWVMHETARSMLQIGHQVFIIAGLAPSGVLYYRNRLTSALTRQDCPLDTTMGYPVFRGWPLETGLPQVVRRVRPDVALLEGGGNAVPIVTQLLGLKVPAVVRLHDSSLHLLKGTPRDLPGTGFVAVSEFLAARFRETFGETATVIPPLTHPERCAVNSTRSKVVFVNPRRIKGGDIVIAVAERHPEIPFRLFGAWAKDDEQKAYARRAAQLPNVEWMAPVMDPREIYRDAHTVLIPSRGNETWGRVATEAHFSAIPVIATNRGGLPEAVGPGGVLLEPDAGVDEWSQALQSLWSDRTRYQALSEQAGNFGRRKEIAVETIVRCTHDVLSRAIQGG